MKNETKSVAYVLLAALAWSIYSNYQLGSAFTETCDEWASLTEIAPVAGQTGQGRRINALCAERDSAGRDHEWGWQ